MGERKVIEPAAWGRELGWYRQNRLSPAVQVGDLLFVSGCTGAEAAADGARAQMRLAYQEISARSFMRQARGGATRYR